MTDPLTDAVYEYLKGLVGVLRRSGASVHVLEGQEWVRGHDGFIRRQVIERPFLGLLLRTYKDQDPIAYRSVAAAIEHDPYFGRVLEHMVGDDASLSRFDIDTVLGAASQRIAKADGSLALRKSRVAHELARLRRYVRAKDREYVLIVPLAGLRAERFPFVIEDGIEIDRLTDGEVGACVGAGVLRSMSDDFPVLSAEECVGVRVVITGPARMIASDQLEATQQQTSDELQAEMEKPHRFGERKRWHMGELVEDVLFVLRLSRSEFVGTHGGVMISTNHMGTSRTWVARPTRQFVRTSYEIDRKTARDVRSRWRAMKAQAGKKHSLPSICERRFNAAMDRTSLDDAVVDHMIAAEALFLRGTGSPEDRGELGFRLSLRAAKFIARDEVQRVSMFKFIKTAYGVRSTISHGDPGPKTVKVPGRAGPPVPLSEFVEELGSTMRAALNRAVDAYGADPNFGTVDYWENLSFSG
jgi:hypothetical protein